MDTNNMVAMNRISLSFQKQSKKKTKIKYILLYQAIKECIFKIELPYQWILPATRTLAVELGLSRTTVVKAYELLCLEKLLISKKGSSYAVNFIKEKTVNFAPNRLYNENVYPAISERGHSFLDNITLLNKESDKGIAFRPGLPPLDIFPVNQWKSLLNTYWRNIKTSGLSNAPSSGLNPLKVNICNYLNISRNILCDPEQLIIVSGSLQALYLISNALINKGDTVIVENPTFPNVHSIFKSTQANIVPIPLDDEGISISDINRHNHLCPKLLHVTPSNHYPLSVKMSLKRRKELTSWASENKAMIIENDYENEVNSQSGVVPSIFSLDTEDRTVYLGTFNRLMHPTIRLSYMIVPKFLIKTIEAIQGHSYKFVDPSIQIVMSQFIEKNYLYKHLLKINSVAQEREALFMKHFNEGTQKMSIEKKPSFSLHLVANFKEEINPKKEASIVQMLLQQNIVAHSLSGSYIGDNKKTGLILGYSSVRPATIQQKVLQMTQLLNKNL